MRFLRVLALSPCLLMLYGLFGSGAAIGDVAQRGMTNKQAESHRPTAAVEPISFREDVEPFLRANCGSCHSSDKHNSGFVVETPENLFKGGSKFAGRVIVPGKAANSAIIAYLR